MANSSDMNVALRFHADVSQARAEVKSLQSALASVGTDTQIDTKPIDNLGKSAKNSTNDTQHLVDAYARGSQTIVTAIQQLTTQMAATRRVRFSLRRWSAPR